MMRACPRRVRQVGLLLVAGLLAQTAAAHSAECDAAGAVFEMAAGNAGQIVLQLLTEPTVYSDLKITVTEAEHGQSFDFSLTASNGYGNFYAIPDDESVSDSGLIAFFFQREGDRLVAYEPGLPSAGAPAPDAIFIPELGSALWYGTNGSDAPVAMATQIWYRAACGG